MLKLPAKTMRARVLWFAFFSLGILLGAPSISAQDDDSTQFSAENALDNVPINLEFITEIVPAIEAPENTEPAQKTLFDASATTLLSRAEYGSPSYSWDFGDGSRTAFGEQVYHTFTEPGWYEVQLTVRQGTQAYKRITDSILVYDRVAAAIVPEGSDWQPLQQVANSYGVLIQPLFLPTSQAASVDNTLALRQLLGQQELLSRASIWLFVDDYGEVITPFYQFWKNLPAEQQTQWREKSWWYFSDKNLSEVQKATAHLWQRFAPQQWWLAKPEAFSILLKGATVEQQQELLEQSGVPYIALGVIENHHRFSVLSRLFDFFAAEGVNKSTLYLLIVVPFIACGIAFFRNVVGLSSFGVFAPLLLTLSGFVMGHFLALVVLFTVLLISIFSRRLLDYLDLLYVPRTALLFSLLSLAFLAVLAGVIWWEDYPPNLTLLIFPMLGIVVVSEKILVSLSQEGLKSTLLTLGETLVIAGVCYWFLSWETVRNLILLWPEVVALPLILTIWIGRFTGLRITEYFKFRSLFLDDAQE